MNEKQPLLGGLAQPSGGLTAVPNRIIGRNVSPFRIILSICLATVLLTLIFTTDEDWDIVVDPDEPLPQDDSFFDWSKVKPSKTLQYTPCYKSNYCARLEVPLDWNSTNPDGAKAVLAIYKRPAEVDVTHPSYGGAILFNPGGPGGSGVQLMQIHGESFASILNVDLTVMGTNTYANTSRFYDLISWDPRGVANTRPLIKGYKDAKTAEENDQRFVDLSSSLQYQDVFNKVYDLKGMFGKLMSLPQAGYSDDEQPVRFMGTTSVVRDMVEIIEKHGEWREKAARQIIKVRQDRGEHMTAAEHEAIKQRTAYHKSQEKLQYWGFSYGTIIGQTFATMYPDRVGRVAIDGVVNATDYYAGEWRTELIDSDRISKNFTRECEAAGPERCSLAQLTQNTGKSLLNAFDETISDVQNVPVTGLVDGNPVYVTDYILTSLLFVLWYTGFIGYNVAADMVSSAAARDASFFYRQFPQPPPDNSTEFNDPSVSQSLILCSDSESKLNETREEHWKYIQFLRKQSKHYGIPLSRVTLPCHTFEHRPKWRFAGPFGAQTANPILVLSQTLDPVTPLLSAQGAAALFSGSQIVEAQGIGHTTLGYPSICANKEIKKYFYTGEVPKEYTHCAAAIRPFHSLKETATITNNLPAEDRIILASALKIARQFPPDNEGLKYARPDDDLPGEEAGAWWSDQRQSIVSLDLQDLVDVQYRI